MPLLLKRTDHAWQWALHSVLLALLCTAASVQAKDRKWVPAEVVNLKQSQIEVESTLYRSSGPNNTMSAPPLQTGADKHTKDIYTYTFKTDTKQIEGISEKKPIEGLTKGMKVWSEPLN